MQALNRRQQLATVNIKNSQKILVIPQEIVEKIIEALQFDHSALKRCSLVCATWLPASRFHLFGYIYISFTYEWYERKFLPLITILRNPSCTFTRSIRRLAIGGIDDDIDASGQRRHLFSGWLDPLLPHLPKLVSVTSLRAHEINTWNISESWSWMLHLRKFTTHITELELGTDTFFTFLELSESIVAFPSLVRLKLHSVDGSQSRGVVEGDFAFANKNLIPSTLRTLELNSSGSTAFTLEQDVNQYLFAWLLQSQILLDTISVGSWGIGHHLSKRFTGDKYDIFSRYLQFVGPSLGILRVFFSKDKELALFVENADLQRNPMVREFEVGCALDALPSLPSLLLGMSGNSLHTIRFEFSLPCGDETARSQLLETLPILDEILSGPRFRALESIKFGRALDLTYDWPHCFLKGILVYPL